MSDPSNWIKGRTRGAEKRKEDQQRELLTLFVVVEGGGYC